MAFVDCAIKQSSIHLAYNGDFIRETSVASDSITSKPFSSVGCQYQSLPASQIALFDATHGQANWAETGFASREMHTNFVGVTETLCRLGCGCRTSGQQPLSTLLPQARLLVIPPPTGRYNVRQQRWMALNTSLFTTEEIRDILAFVQTGGRLIAFAYRFGDSFTQSNLRELFGPFGCLLNDDAVIDLHTLRTAHPLQAYFETSCDSLPQAWSQPQVQTVRWHAVATFTIPPGATAAPLALSPGGCCISYDRTQRRISFESLPIAVAGLHGRGRFVLFGGPHVFETGTHGLFTCANNARFLKNVLQWVLGDDQAGIQSCELKQPSLREWFIPDVTDSGRELSRVECKGSGKRTVATVERILRQTGTLKALSRAGWMP